MSVQPYVLNDALAPNSIIWAWTNLQLNQSGQPAELLYGAGRLWVQVGGTPGSGGVVMIEGSITGTQWGQLILENNNAAQFGTAGGGALRGTPRLIRPRVVSGDANTAFTVHISFAGFKVPG